MLFVKKSCLNVRADWNRYRHSMLRPATKIWRDFIDFKCIQTNTMLELNN